ncbi:MAG: hypothetical protein L6Q71_00295 [Planctomycetes bacterium]|nr:hypothetical protein [Planctomycetota bacterium]NUQ35185.1 hypothetical protein [Planctomycetaceae bacterium]
MGIFKSKEEKRMERDMEIKKAISKIKRHIGQLAKSEQDWLEKAKRAKKLDSGDQLAFMRKSLKATAFQRRMLERQLLTIEAAKQMKDQAESYVAFADSMNAVSQSIGAVYKDVDLSQTQVQFERAMAQAESMSQRMDIFLDMSKDSLFTAESSMGEELISDAEIDRMMGVDPTVEKKKSRAELDKEIAAELGDDDADEKEKP